MPDKWTRPRSLGELQNQSYDHINRITKMAPFGWDGSDMVQVKVNDDGIQEVRVGGIPRRRTGNYSTAQTDTVIWTPATGKTIVLMGAVFSTDTAMSVSLSSDANYIIPPLYFSLNGGANISGISPIWKGAIDSTLTITSSDNGNHSVMLWGYEE